MCALVQCGTQGEASFPPLLEEGKWGLRSNLEIVYYCSFDSSFLFPLSSNRMVIGGGNYCLVLREIFAMANLWDRDYLRERKRESDNFVGTKFLEGGGSFDFRR